jgi:hypothetical protein
MAYKGTVHFKTGLLVGLAVGYYYGAKAGRERYLQIDHYLSQVRASEAYRDARSRLGDLVDETVERARQAVGDVTPTPPVRPYDYTGDPTLN